jgi:hypothetical protein
LTYLLMGLYTFFVYYGKPVNGSFIQIIDTFIERGVIHKMPIAQCRQKNIHWLHI